MAREMAIHPGSDNRELELRIRVHSNELSDSSHACVTSDGCCVFFVDGRNKRTKREMNLSLTMLINTDSATRCGTEDG
jgi:hypothetical protein